MPNKTGREAAFAFELACEATSFKKATYKKGPGSRKDLALDPDFHGIHHGQARIRDMEYCWVEETNSTCQCKRYGYRTFGLGTACAARSHRNQKKG